jgi:hypothetical protein
MRCFYLIATKRLNFGDVLKLVHSFQVLRGLLHTTGVEIPFQILRLRQGPQFELTNAALVEVC